MRSEGKEAGEGGREHEVWSAVRVSFVGERVGGMKLTMLIDVLVCHELQEAKNRARGREPEREAQETSAVCCSATAWGSLPTHTHTHREMRRESCRRLLN